MKFVERACKFIYYLALALPAHWETAEHCWLPLLNFVSGLRLNTIPRSASAAHGWLEDNGLRPEVQLVSLRSDYLFGAFLPAVGVLQASLFVKPCLLGSFLRLVLSLLLFKELVLGAIFGSHAGHLHRFNGALDHLIALLEHSDITAKFIAVVLSGREAKCHNEVIDAALEGENLSSDLGVGALEAVEFSLLGTLHLVLHDLQEQ